MTLCSHLALCSAAKAPFRARFKVRHCGLNEVVKMNRGKSKYIVRHRIAYMHLHTHKHTHSSLPPPVQYRPADATALPTDVPHGPVEGVHLQGGR